MRCEMAEQGKVSSFWAPIFALIGTLAGVVLGGYLSHKNTQELFAFQKMYELRMRSYSRLSGLRVPLLETVESYHKAGTLAQYYNVRYSQLSHSDTDRQLSNSENERLIKTQSAFTDLQREFHELLGDVLVSYEFDNDSIQKVYSLFDIQYPALLLEDKGSIKTYEDLENWKKTVDKQIFEYKNSLYEKTMVLLNFMYGQVREISYKRS